MSTIETLEKRREICSKLTIKTPKRLLLTLNILHAIFNASVVDFDQLNVKWVMLN